MNTLFFALIFGFLSQSTVYIPQEPTEETINPSSSEIVFRSENMEYKEGLAVVVENRLYGYANEDMGLQIPYMFDEASNFHEGFAVVSTEDRDGFDYIDIHGNFITDQNFTYASDFYDGIAVVHKDYMFAYLKNDGTMLTDFEYTHAYTFNYGVCAANGDFGGRLIDREGNIIFEWSEGDINLLGENRLALYSGPDCMLADFEGNILSDKKYNHINSFVNGYASFYYDDLMGSMDMNGNEVIPPTYEIVRNFHDGLAVCGFDEESENGLPPREYLEFVNEQGEVVTDMSIYSAKDFSEGLASITTISGDSYSNGYIDTSGNLAIDAQFKVAESFWNGYAVVAIVDENLDYQYGVIDKSGNFVIEPMFFNIVANSNGTFSVRTADYNTGVLDSSGEIIIPFEYYNIYHHYDDFYIAEHRSGEYSTIKFSE